LAKTQVSRVMLATASCTARLASDVGLLATTSRSLATGERCQFHYGFAPILTNTSQFSHVKPLNHQQCYSSD